MMGMGIEIQKYPEEIESEQRIKIADAAHRRKIDWILLRFTSAVVLVQTGLCSWIVITKGLSRGEGQLAFGVLVVMVWALAGYYAGKSSK